MGFIAGAAAAENIWAGIADVTAEKTGSGK